MAQDTLENLKLVKNVKNKDRKSLNVFFEKYYDFVYTNVEYFFETRLAEEIAMDVLRKVISKINLFDKNRGCFKSWLYMVTKNHYIEILKSSQFKERKKIEYKNPIIFENYEYKEQLDIISDDSYIKFLNIYVNLLEETDRDIMMKRFFYNKKYQEIAEELKINVNIVKSRIRRGKIKIRKVFLLQDSITDEDCNILEKIFINCLNQLDKKSETIMIEKFIYNKKYKEIKNELKIDINIIKNCVSKSKKQILKFIKSSYEIRNYMEKTFLIKNISDDRDFLLKFFTIISLNFYKE